MIRLLLLLLFAIVPAAPAKAQPGDVLESGLRSIMQRQSDDGGWHSQHYGSLKQGAAVTTTILYALSHLPDASLQPYREQIQRAYGFLQPGLKKSGFVTNPEGSEDYPVYCTAMLLVACQRLDLDLDHQIQTRMVRYLLNAQVADQRGFSADHAEYGGWDVLGPNTLAGKTSGTNVSATCFVVEALAGERDQRDVERALALTGQWIQRMARQSSDGGFFFTPKLDSMNNKAKWSDDAFRNPNSYGTATCDGLRILKACGFKSDSASFAAAAGWLAKHNSLKTVPGFMASGVGEGEGESSEWEHALKYYYMATLAKSLALLPEDVAKKRKQQLIDELTLQQQTSGLWRNPSALMREDDPLIASAFALIALGIAVDR